MQVEVIVESEASPAARRAVRCVLDNAGLTDVEVRPAYIRESADDLPWQIFIMAPLALFWGKFVTAAAEDAWKFAKTLVLKLYDDRRAVEGQLLGSIVLTDSTTGIDFVLSEDLPDEAYERLRMLGPVRAQFSGVLVWDGALDDWADPLRGKFTCDYPGCDEPATLSQVKQRGESYLRRMFCDEHDRDAMRDDSPAWD